MVDTTAWVADGTVYSVVAVVADGFDCLLPMGLIAQGLYRLLAFISP